VSIKKSTELQRSSAVYPTLDVDQELDLTLLDFPAETPCQSRRHGRDKSWHDSRPAAYLVHVHCDGCSDDQLVAQCARRVQLIAISRCTMTCPHCGHTAGWEAFWIGCEVL
jgi:hypothetical protein